MEQSYGSLLSLKGFVQCPRQKEMASLSAVNIQHSLKSLCILLFQVIMLQDGCVS